MQLERLEAVQKPNPRSPRRSMMSLYLQAEVESAWAPFSKCWRANEVLKVSGLMWMHQMSAIQ